MSKYEIQKYSKNHKEEVLELLERNTPDYFDPSEKEEFVQYLDSGIDDYFIVLNKKKLIACGGIDYFPNEESARIVWDMVDPEYQHKGIGASLINHRIKYIKEKNLFKRIIVRTSQFAFKFYAKFGFNVKRVERNYWAKGFDLYLMKYTL
jgi:N-acetylglutamate synthase-like GNAT family acetyltransferase